MRKPRIVRRGQKFWAELVDEFAGVAGRNSTRSSRIATGSSAGPDPVSWTYLDRWNANWADKRIHGTTKRQVATMFEEERPHLLPLPVEPFRYYQHGDRTVHLDGQSRSTAPITRHRPA